jgi:hypothetical protein
MKQRIVERLHLRHARGIEMQTGHSLLLASSSSGVLTIAG